MIVAGIDFGTLSVRVSLFDHQRGRLGSATGEYPLHRRAGDPDFATQSHADHLRALIEAMGGALRSAGVEGREVESLAIATTGSSVVAVDSSMQPLGDYYLWCDHRAWREAAEITAAAREQGLPALDWSGGFYSSEWGFAKLLHWLRQNADLRPQFASAFEHCDLIAATLCGVRTPGEAARSVCAMGHKWMWNESLGGLPSDDFLLSVDRLFAGVREKLQGRYATSTALAGHLAPEWAARLGLRAGIPIPVGALDAHWDAIGAGIRPGDAVNVIGTSSCIMAIGERVALVPGLCGVVPGSIDPTLTGLEAGLSACGDVFEAIATRAGRPLAEVAAPLAGYRVAQTGLLRIPWDNGDRTILGNPELGGVTLGWNLAHTASDELFAAIEGTACHTRIILDHMAAHGVPVDRVINAGGIPQRNETLNRVYANILAKPVLVPAGDVTSLGSAIFAFLAAGAFPSIIAAQEALCPPHRTVEPDGQQVSAAAELFGVFRGLYHDLGRSEAFRTLRSLRTG